MRIYVAGPYMLGDPVVNTRNAVLVAEALVQKGHSAKHIGEWAKRKGGR